jgi:cation transport ATPase
MDDPLAEDGYRALAEALAGRPRGEADEAVAAPVATAMLPLQPAGMTLEGAAADEQRGRGLNTTPEPVAKAAQRARREAESHSRYHTLLPRLMVIAALLAALGSPVFLEVLRLQDHLRVEGNDWFFDDRGRRLAVAGVAVIGTCFVLGWLWWGVAAALNARRRSRHTVTPLLVPFTIALTVAALYFVPQLMDEASGRADNHNTRVLIAGVLVALALITHFASLSAYRRAAGAVGGNQRPWSFIIILPWVCLGLNLLARFFTTAVGDSYLTVIALVNMAFVGAYIYGMHQALASFDRACVGRRMAHSDREEVPNFLRRA